MTKNRVEAFSDGVFAILITIMVLELKTPKGDQFSDLSATLPVFLSYVMSFIYLGIYWNNHHHLFHATHHVKGSTLWANLHLLFWLSLIPFVTAWVGSTDAASIPTALYGVVLLMCAVAYWILARVLVSDHDQGSLITRAIGRDLKGKVSMVLYLFGAVCSFYSSLVGGLTYVLVAALWLIPDRRIEAQI